MEALFFKFSKRINSTKQVDDSTGVRKEISIRQNFTTKEGDRSCSELRPIIFINDVSNNFNYNYMKLFGRYYFIDEIHRWIDHSATLYASIDALGTCKANILNTEAKVLYSSSDYSLDLDDNRNKLSQNVSYADSISDDPMFEHDIGFGGGTYILTAIGLHGADCNHTFFLSQTEYKKVTDYLCGLTLSDISQGLEAFLNPASCISSVRYSPVYLRGTAATDITLGKLQVPGVVGNYYPNRFIGTGGKSIRISVPHIYPNDYRGGSRFSKFYLTIPFCGVYPINADDIYGQEYITLTYRMDVVTGDIAGRVYTGTSANPSGNGNLITFSGNCYSDVPFGQITDPLGATVVTAITNAASLGFSAMLGGATTTGSSMAGYYRTATSNQRAAATFNGSFSGNSLLSGMERAAATTGITGASLSSAIGVGACPDVHLICVANESADNPIAIQDILGLPCAKTRIINGLSGYCQTTGFSVEIDDLASIADMVNQAMDNGVFIE